MPQAAIRHYEDDEHMSGSDVDQHAVSQVQAEEPVVSDKAADSSNFSKANSAFSGCDANLMYSRPL